MKGSRAWFLAEFYGLVQRHVMQAYPFWNRTGGRDHLWPVGLDEGGCVLPKALWPATVLSHWGNTGRVHKGAFTAVGQEMWTAIPVTLHGMHRCFNPRKDIVMPAWTPPNVEHLHEQYWAKCVPSPPLPASTTPILSPPFHLVLTCYLPERAHCPRLSWLRWERPIRLRQGSCIEVSCRQGNWLVHGRVLPRPVLQPGNHCS